MKRVDIQPETTNSQLDALASEYFYFKSVCFSVRVFHSLALFWTLLDYCCYLLVVYD